MSKILYTFSFVVCIIHFSFAQSFHVIYSSEVLQDYQKTNAFNKQKYNLKSNYSHQLDSTISSTLSGKSSKFIYLYDKKRDICTKSRWDEESEQWLPDAYNVLHFDNDRLVRQTYNSWEGEFDNLDEQTPIIARDFIYDEHKRILEIQVPNLQENRIHNIKKYSYNEAGLLQNTFNYFWVANVDSLVLEEEVEYRHNEENLLSEILNYTNDESIGWSARDSIIFSYNLTGQLELETRYKQSPNQDSFEFSLRRDFYYNQDGSLSLIEERNKFNDLDKIKYNYHPYGSLHGLRKIDDTDPDFVWGLFYNLYLHDENITSDKIRFPRTRFSGSFFDLAHYYERHMLLSSREFLGGGNLPLELQLRTDYFYTELEPSSIETFDSKNTYVFPNPSTSFLNIKNNKLIHNTKFSVFNLIGELVLVKNLFSQDQLIDVSSLTNGLYFYKIQIEGKSVSGQFVVQR